MALSGAANVSLSLANKHKTMKSLPTYIPEDPEKTQVVRLKKIKNRLYQDCDVYIGPKMQNKYWIKNESVWVNPFHHTSGDRSKVLKAYREHILSNEKLVALLPTLKGKRLGCFCENLDYCHGTVLKSLVEELEGKSFVDSEKALFFKGEDCPLSNLYRCQINEFSSAEHYRLWLIAKRMGQMINLGLMQNHKGLELSTANILELGKQVLGQVQRTPDQNYSQQDQIYDMIKVTEAKYKQVESFRKFCLKHVTRNKILVESTSNTFWGSGVDFTSVDADVLTKNLFTDGFPGQNVLGFILMYVVARNRGDFTDTYKGGAGTTTTTETETENSSAPSEIAQIVEKARHDSHDFRSLIGTAYKDEYYSFLKKMRDFYRKEENSNMKHSPEERDKILNSGNSGLEYLYSIEASLTSEQKLSNFGRGLANVIFCVWTNKHFIH